jgi:hypothetical protein
MRRTEMFHLFLLGLCVIKSVAADLNRTYQVAEAADTGYYNITWSFSATHFRLNIMVPETTGWVSQPRIYVSSLNPF